MMRGFEPRHREVSRIQRLVIPLRIDRLWVADELDEGCTVIPAPHVFERGRATGTVAGWTAETLKRLLPLRDLMAAIEHAHENDSTEGQHHPMPILQALQATLSRTLFSNHSSMPEIGKRRKAKFQDAPLSGAGFFR